MLFSFLNFHKCCSYIINVILTTLKLNAIYFIAHMYLCTTQNRNYKFSRFPIDKSMLMHSSHQCVFIAMRSLFDFHISIDAMIIENFSFDHYWGTGIEDTIFVKFKLFIVFVIPHCLRAHSSYNYIIYIFCMRWNYCTILSDDWRN